MAAPSGAALQVQVSANIDKFTKQMRETGAIADRAVHDIEDKFSRANPSIGGGFFGGLGKGALSGLLSGAVLERLGRAIFDANREMATLDTTARRVGLSLEKLQQFRFAASAAGIDPKVMDETLQSLAKQVNDLTRFSNQESALGKFAKDNNITLRDRNGILISTEELLLRIANIVSDTTKEQDKIELAKRLNIPVEALKVLELSAQHIKDMGARAKELGAILTDDVINQAIEFDKKWSLAWAAWTIYGKSALLTIGNGIGSLIDGFTNRMVDAARQAKTTRWTPSASQIIGPSPVSELKKVAETASSATAELGKATAGVVTEVAKAATGAASELDKVVELEEKAATAGDDVIDKLKKIRREILNPTGDAPTLISTLPETRRTRPPTDLGPLGAPPEPFQERAAPPPPPPPPAPRALPAATTRPQQPAVLSGDEPTKVKEAKEALDRYIDSLMRQQAVEAAITATLGQSQPMRQAAIELAKAEVVLSQLSGKAKEDYVAKLKKEVIALEELRMKREAAQRHMQGINDATRFFGELTLDVFDKLIEGGAKFEDILKDIAKSIAKAALQAALLGSGPLAGLFGTSPTSAGGVGGILGALISGFTPRAEGGSVTAGRGYMVGERGRELFVPSMNGRIIPNNVIARGGGGSSVVNNRTIHIDARGSERGVEQKILAAFAEYDRGLLPRIQEKQLRFG